MTLKKERLIVLVTNLWSKLKKSNLKMHRMSSFLLISMMIPAIFSSQNSYADSVELNNNVKLTTSSHSPVAISSDLSEIKPGESKTEKETREQAEAKAKAAEEAKAKSSRNVVSRERRVYNDPSNFDEIYSQAGSAYGVDPRILKAVHTVETGRSGSTQVSSYAGAQGPMQFLPSTWRRYGVDGNGDGSADISNVSDAIFTAAKYLKACGYPDVKKALWGYNPSMSYYNKVMGVATSLGF